MSYKYAFAAAVVFAALPFTAAQAEEYVLTLKDHQFTPQPLVLPANTKLTLTVKNEQKATAEFESSDLDREKVVGAGSQITVLLGPLEPGSYGYFDDFHRETTGTIVVK